MRELEGFYGYFNIVLGSIMILIGFEIYKPFKTEKGQRIFNRLKDLYRFGGIGILIWGLIKIFG